MAQLFTASRPLFFVPATNPSKPFFSSLLVNPNSMPFSLRPQPKALRFSRVRSSLSSESGPGSESGSEPANVPVISDERGERYEPGPEKAASRLADSDPPWNEDEWEERGDGDGGAEEENVGGGNRSAAHDRVWELKKCLADTVYGTEFGFSAGSEVRAEVLELVNQLEALNPTAAPVEAPELLDGKWVLIYTAFSELLPLLAAGATPLLKVKNISQSINTSSLSIDNSTTLSSPFADFSFSATAAFEVRSPSRIQVTFKEGTLQPPEIKSRIELPENFDVFGQRLSLSSLQQALNPLQEVAANISRTISGQQPLKLPIPGNRSSSWLLTTYLDKDLRISRGDGGLFVLAREGSPLLEP